MHFLITFISAFLFAVGLSVSAMTNPENIIGFLDILGNWKPALLLVMVGAIAVQSTVYFLIRKRSSPYLDFKFQIPSTKSIDRHLILGSVLFGVGWGIGGFCPGPAVVSLVSLNPSVLIFALSMFIGFAIFHFIFKPLCLEESK